MSALLIILISLTMTLFSEKVLVSNKCISGLMSDMIKKSWTDSNIHISQDTFWFFNTISKWKSQFQITLCLAIWWVRAAGIFSFICYAFSCAMPRPRIRHHCRLSVFFFSFWLYLFFYEMNLVCTFLKNSLGLFWGLWNSICGISLTYINIL